MNYMKKILFLILYSLVTITYSQQNDFWEVINFPDTLNPVCINGQSENILFVSGIGNSFGGLFRSFDDGQTWEHLVYDSIWPNSAPYNIKFSNDNTLFIGNGTGIYRSIDNGDSFVKVYSGMYGGMKFRFSPENHLYTTGWGSMLRTTDNGNSWDTISYHGWTQYYSDISFGVNGELYAVGGGYHPLVGGFFRSMDGGGFWQNIGITDEFLNSVLVNSNGVILAGGFSANEVYTSDDQGVTWVQTGNVLADEMEKYGDDLIIAGANVNSNTGIWFSEDWGESWIDLLDGILYPYRQIKNISVSENNTIYVRGVDGSTQQNGKVFKSVNPMVAIKTTDQHRKTTIYPNPCSSTVRINNHFDIYNDYMILDLLGRIILKGDLENNEINVSELRPGSYIFIINSTESSQKIKFEKI